MEGPSAMRLLLPAPAARPGFAAAQSLTRDDPDPAPARAAAGGDRLQPARLGAAGVPVPPGYRDARPNLDPFLPHRSGIEQPIQTPAFGRGG